MKNKLIEWLIENETDLVLEMQETFHGYMGIEDNPYHMEGSIWTHTKMVMDQADKFNTIELYIAAMLHDIGKVKVWEDKPESKRRRFTSHEAVSTFMAKPILEKLQETYIFDKMAVLETIAKHGSLYNYFTDGRINPKHFEKIASSFKSKKALEMLKDFYYCDHEGRIQEVPSAPIEYVINDFDTIIKMIDDTYKGTQVLPSKQVTVLIGTPRSGKSTYVANKYPNGTAGFVDVISRDDLVEEYGEGKTYSEKWKSLSKEGQKDIDKKLQEKFHSSGKIGNSMIIDMTNMSRKSRRKWLTDNKLKDYYKKAVLVLVDKETVMSRMNDEKYIPEGVIDSMMCSFVYPDYNEFDHIEVL